MTQKTLFGNDERVVSCKTILENTASQMSADIPEDKWRAVVMWTALLQYPDVLELFKIATELKRHAPNEIVWIEMLQSKLQDSARFDDIPSFETLSRSLRDVQAKYWNKIDPYKYGTLAKTLR